MGRSFNRIVGAEKIHSLFTFEESILVKLRKVIAEKAQELLARVKSKVSGGVLKTRKGKLLKSLQLATYEGKGGPGAKIFSNWYIARFYERGYGGKDVPVKAHHRRSKGVTKKAARDFRRGNGARPEGLGDVKAHSRKLPRFQKSFLKASLDEMRGSIRAALAAAATKGM